MVLENPVIYGLNMTGLVDIHFLNFLSDTFDFGFRRRQA